MYNKIVWLVKNSRIYKKVLKLYHGLKGERLIKLSPALLLMTQNRGGEFNRFDVIARLMAFEEIDGKSKAGVALYQEMQNKRNDYLRSKGKKIKSEDLNKSLSSLEELLSSFKKHGFDEKNPIAVNPGLRIVDGSHRLACALYTGIEKVVIERSETAEIDYGLDWFEENLDQIYVGNLKQRYHSLLASFDIKSILKEILFREKQVFGRGEFYQSFEQIGIEGQRPTSQRYQIYNLDEHLHPNYNVLDIGCNTGFFTLVIADKVKSITGIEINPTLVEIANITKAYLGKTNVTFKSGNFNSISLDGDFDFICSFAVHHWLAVDMKKYGLKLLKLLKPGGKVLLESQNIHQEDKDWEDKLRKFMQSGFEQIDQGTLKDDGKIERKYSILKRI